MQNTKTFLPWLLRILISVLFLLSAVAKLFPSPYFAISTFEVKQLYPMGFSEELAAYFSRILIGIEFAFGVLILQNNFLRKFIIPSTILLLAVFTAHLSIESYINGGNTGNCGCFGSLLPMTPIQAILKNVFAILLLLILFFILPKKVESKGNFWILTTVTLAFILLLFMIAPIQPKVENAEIDTTAIEQPEELQQIIVPVKTDSIFKTIEKDAVKKEIPKLVDEPLKKKSGYAQFFPSVDSGKKVFCFFVPGCDHCKVAAKELTEMKAKDKNFPAVNIVFMNEEADLIPEFFKFAGANYPYKVIEIIPFWKALGTGVDTPVVKYLWNGNEYAYYYGITDHQFDAKEFENTVNKPFVDFKKK
jgi:hypothetical protein